MKGIERGDRVRDKHLKMK